MSELALEAKIIGMGEIIDPEGLSVDGGLDDAVLDHPVQKLFEQAGCGRFAKLGDWNEQISSLSKAAITGTPAPHADGTVTEKWGEQTWSYTYKDGKLVSMHVSDPDLPGSGMYFDSLGNEVKAGTLEPVSI